MSFEEEFPSLKELRMEAFVEEDGDVGYTLDSDGDYVQVFDVERYCLDKARVLKAIDDERAGSLNSNYQTKCWNDALDRIKKRLRL